MIKDSSLAKARTAGALNEPKPAHTPGPWVWCDWTILDGDREAQRRREPYWTMIAGASALAQGPLGRKSMWPETIISAEGYETEGVSANNDSDAALIAAAPDGYALAQEVLRILYEKAGPENEHLSDDEANLWNQARAFISKCHGMDGAAPEGERSGTP